MPQSAPGTPATAIDPPPGDSDELGDAGSLVVEDHGFAIVGDWVINAEISDAAFPVYSLLLRFGGTSGNRMPSRGLLARRLHRSVDSIDRALRSSSTTASSASSTDRQAARPCRTATTSARRHRPPQRGPGTVRPPWRSRPRRGAAANLRPTAVLRPPALLRRPRPQICGPTEMFLPRHLLRQPPSGVGPAVAGEHRRRPSDPSCSPPAASPTSRTCRAGASPPGKRSASQPPAGPRSASPWRSGSPSPTEAGPPRPSCPPCSRSPPTRRRAPRPARRGRPMVGPTRRPRRRRRVHVRPRAAPRRPRRPPTRPPSPGPRRTHRRRTPPHQSHRRPPSLRHPRPPGDRMTAPKETAPLPDDRRPKAPPNHPGTECEGPPGAAGARYASVKQTRPSTTRLGGGRLPLRDRRTPERWRTTT
jgi:hypothetical protein